MVFGVRGLGTRAGRNRYEEKIIEGAAVKVVVNAKMSCRYYSIAYERGKTALPPT